MYDFEAKILDRSLFDFLEQAGFFIPGGALHGLLNMDDDAGFESDTVEEERDDEEMTMDG